MSAVNLPLHELSTERVSVAELHTYHRNPRRGDLAAITRSLLVNGQYRPLVVNRGTYTGRAAEVLAGNHTLLAAREAGWPQVVVCWVDVDDDHAARIVAADNRTADLGDYDQEVLSELLGSLDGLDGSGYTDADLAVLLAGDAGDPAPPLPRPVLADRFLIPPFTVFNSRSGWWQERKRAWLGTGIASQEGRAQQLVYQAGKLTPAYYDQKQKAETKLGRALSRAEFEQFHLVLSPAAGTSVFDPVLCEVVYRWFCPPGGYVLDPWAGGSVRGLTAALLGRNYIGIDLRAEQVAANEAQAAKVLVGDVAGLGTARWVTGDAGAMLPNAPGSADLVFGCPPYFDLERYSADPADLSAMDDAGFMDSYRAHLGAAAERLAADRFAVLVVSSARNSRGLLRDLRGLTVAGCEAAGLALYNEAVLVTPVGSAAISAATFLTSTRVLSRTHQDVLIFVKGDRRVAAAACGDAGGADLEAALAAAVAADEAAAGEPASAG